MILGHPKSILSELIITPQEILRRGNSYRINAIYYIEKCLNPALVRLLSLCGVDVVSWYRSITKPKIRRRFLQYETLPPPQIEGRDMIPTVISGTTPMASIVSTNSKSLKQTSLDNYVYQSTCTICDESDASPKTGLCQSCSKKPDDSLVTMFHRLNTMTLTENSLKRVCMTCSQMPQNSNLFVKGDMIGRDSCSSTDCSIFFERCRLITRIEDIQASMRDLI